MEILWSLWEIVVNCIECGFFYYLLKKQLGVAQRKKRVSYVILIVLIGVVSALNLYGVHFSITMGTMFLLKLSYAVFAFESNTIRRVFWGCIAAAIPFVCDSLITVVLTWLPGVDINSTFVSGFARLGTTILYCLIAIFICWSLAHIRVESEISMPKFYPPFMVAILLLGLFSVAGSLSIAFQSDRSLDERIMITSVISAILLMVITIICLFERIGVEITRKVKAEAKLQEYHLDEEHNRNTAQVITAWRHDLHNYLEVLQILLETNDYTALKQYVGEMRKDFQDTFLHVDTGSAATNAILSSKQMIAHDQNIQMHFDTCKLPSLPISETKMCVLLGNLLDNALEACARIEDEQRRWIHLRLAKHRGMLSIIIENSSSGEYNYQDSQLKSSKGSKYHGYGLKRVEQIIAEADGIYSVIPSIDSFNVTVFLPFRKEGEHADPCRNN